MSYIGRLAMLLRRILYVAGTLLLVPVFSILNGGCTGKYNLPAIPQSNGSSPVISSSNGPLIEVFFLNVSIATVTNGGYVSTIIADNAGNPVTTAAVTLTTPSGSIPVTYAANASSNPPPGMGITNIYGGLYSNATAYAAGQNCSVSVDIGGNIYSSNFTASPASGNVVGGASGVTCTWTNGGNEDLVLVSGNDNLQYGPSPAITSPISSRPPSSSMILREAVTIRSFSC